MRILAGARTALRRVVDLGLVVLIVIVLFGVALGKGAPVVGRQTIIIGGGSMEPTISLGSAIVIRPVAPDALAVGDIVSLQVGAERTTYTHRIIGVVDRADGRWIRTQGDANTAPDPMLVPATAVIGQVELAVPFAGYLLALLSLPMGIVFVLGLGATLLAIAWLLDSVEPAPRRVRRPEASPGPAPQTARSAGDRLDLSAVVPEASPTHAGEPIAARPSGVVGPDLDGPAGLAPDPGWLAVAPVFAPAGVASPARLTVRAQIERSREVRRRRARWLVGRGGRQVTE